jgi:hypothetical protein
MLKIAVVDYDMGNLHSVCKGLQHAGASPLITATPAELAAADAIILPGVGAFDPAMKQIRDRDLERPLQDITATGKPFLFGNADFGRSIGRRARTRTGYHSWYGTPLSIGTKFNDSANGVESAPPHPSRLCVVATNRP